MKMKTNKIKILCVGIVSLFVMTSCLKDEGMVKWENGIYNIVEFAHVSHNVRIQNVKPTANITFTPLYLNYTIPKLEDHKSDVTVSLGIDESRVAKYNSDNALDGSLPSKQPYLLMPASAYTLPTTLNIPAGTRTITWDLPVNTSTLEPGKKYMIPVVITGAPGGITISGNFGYLLLRADMSAT